MITEMMLLVVVGGVGTVLGGIFFLGLWLTVLRALSSKQPALLFVASLLLRTIIVLTGFYFVTVGHWDRLLACLLGFFIARFLVMQLTESPAGHQQAPTREVDHAPES